MIDLVNSKLHPTMKPVGLVEYLIKNSSKQEDIILDPFLGSGTTLMACEKQGRICYGVELDPKYCDVIVKRWEEFTGKKAELENGQN
jgi:DNA modification methylase